MPTRKVQVLVVRSWTDDLEPVRAALGTATLTRVDFEAALWAAVSWQRFDAVIIDRAAPLSRDAVIECLRAHRHEVPVIELGDIDTLAARLDAALAPSRISTRAM